MAETLTASLEDYLEAIFEIIAKKQAARPKDISKRLKVANSSVTGALRSLAEKELINYAPYDLITLTPAGKAVAGEVVRRHEVLQDFFIKVLSVEESVADEAACRMEHSVPEVIVDRLIQFAEFIEVCPRAGSRWISGFGYYCEHGDSRGDCEKCVSATLNEIKTKPKKEIPQSTKNPTLKELKPGEKGKVVRVASRGGVGRRIIEMGVIPGAILEVERIAPLGDPIEIKVKGYHLSLRKEEAEGIEIERI